MYGFKSREGTRFVSLCDCGQDTTRVHYGNVVLHVLRDDLRELGVAMQNVAEEIAQPEPEDVSELKKGLV